MTPAAWGIVGTLFTIFAGCVAIFYYQQSSSRVAAQMQEAKITKAVDDATKPLYERNAELQRLTERQADRIDVLEDELRRGRGHGDNDAARQPRG